MAAISGLYVILLFTNGQLSLTAISKDFLSSVEKPERKTDFPSRLNDFPAIYSLLFNEKINKKYPSPLFEIKH
jgi:hypothetical protein